MSMRQQVPVPLVFGESESGNDYILKYYRDLASQASNRCLSAYEQMEWTNIAPSLRQKIIKEVSVDFFESLDFDVKETGELEQTAFRIKNIAFQTRPGIYATANLYLPKISGPLPAILLTHGHWQGARNADIFRQVAAYLVEAGYVVLSIDAWGAGERSTVAGKEEYHGGNLGASLFNIGKTLMGMQLTDNIRAVDFLCALPAVDTERIGVTGASGGGNQAMWLAALDERLKAVVPVVSVGTFQSYVMNSNCVCELLPGGLTFLEESLVLGLIAPRALKVLSALKEDNPSFDPKQMLCAYADARKIYVNMGLENKLSYQLFDQEHVYSREMILAAIAWFDLHLENKRHKRETGVYHSLDKQLLMTYKNERPAFVETTEGFCRKNGTGLPIRNLIDNTSYADKINELTKLLGHIDDKELKQVIKKGKEGLWQKVVLVCKNDQKIPLLVYEPVESFTSCKLFLHGEGKLAVPIQLIEEAMKTGSMLVLVDLWGLGEQASVQATKLDEQLPPFHTLARSAMWLGRTVLGEWYSDMQVIYKWLKIQRLTALTFTCFKEPSVAGLIFSACHDLSSLVLYESPYSYVFDSRTEVDYYNMSIHLPKVLLWGDVMTMATLSKAQSIQFIQARSMSGKMLDVETEKQLEQDIVFMKERWNKKCNIKFVSN